MKTLNNKLGFVKNSIVELNTETMSTINGGSWTIIIDDIKEKLRTITQ